MSSDDVPSSSLHPAQGPAAPPPARDSDSSTWHTRIAPNNTRTPLQAKIDTVTYINLLELMQSIHERYLDTLYYLQNPFDCYRIQTLHDNHMRITGEIVIATDLLSLGSVVVTEKLAFMEAEVRRWTSGRITASLNQVEELRSDISHDDSGDDIWPVYYDFEPDQLPNTSTNRLEWLRLPDGWGIGTSQAGWRLSAWLVPSRRLTANERAARRGWQGWVNARAVPPGQDQDEIRQEGI
ncbi:MAG: hypothetical protein M1831_000984 [Alyxoria varia]|nr:MAG: hypothetical protein M1831_000984 [Alyxoria varia]